MTDKPIVPLISLDPAAVLALNNDSAEETSPLDPASLARLIGVSIYAGGVAPADAMLIAFDQTADYDSPNFLWLQERFDRFIYIDRVIVAATARGTGLGKRLYEDLRDWARSSGHARIVCEVNTQPDNPTSHAFHLGFGFQAVGDARHSAEKAVRFYALGLR
ncbi:MAG: GNAT family N-acetyltransferase [Pseudomonadota bacterium]